MNGKKPKYNFKANIKIECPTSSWSVNIKSKYLVVPVKMTKNTLVLDDILSQFYSKEWIQNDLRKFGISSTGKKDHLIYRLLNVLRTRNQSVQDTGENVISALPSTELKALARYIGIAANGSRGELISNILDSVNFEPYVESIERGCPICAEKTLHEIHYDNNWRQSYFECTVCGNKTSIEKTNVKHFTKNVENRKSESRDTIEARTASGTLISTSIAIFLSLFFGLEASVSWPVSLLISSFAFVASLLTLAFTRPYWEKYIVILLQKFSRSK